jgi:hypothetical protein
MRRTAYVIGMICVIAGAAAQAQPTTAEAAGESAPEAEKWLFSAAVYTWFVPDDHEFVQPTITADRGRLHLEARYNYEDQNTVSAWVGYNLAGGDKLAWAFTPMIGGVVGDTTGVAPGYTGSLTWWKIELYSEGEYVVDVNDTSDSFFYNWSELTYAPVEWFRFGLLGQRTRAYETDRNIQRGLMAGVTYKQLDLSAYVLNPDDDKPVVAIALRMSF